MTETVDKRGVPLTVTFGELAIGDAYQDEDGDACIKTGYDRFIYYDCSRWAEGNHMDTDLLIIPLNITYTIERGTNENSKQFSILR